MSFLSFHEQKKSSKHILFVILNVKITHLIWNKWCATHSMKKTRVYCFLLLQNVCLLRNIGDLFNESFKICNFVLLWKLKLKMCSLSIAYGPPEETHAKKWWFNCAKRLTSKLANLSKRESASHPTPTLFVGAFEVFLISKKFRPRFLLKPRAFYIKRFEEFENHSGTH